MLIQETRGTKVFNYSYDANGELAMLTFQSNPGGSKNTAYYALNSRGDVIGLYKASGELIAKYTYDVWGNVISVKGANGAEITSEGHMAMLQPFRYRSYYYDSDSGLYYLQSRYYDSVTHRFINADGLVSTGTGVLGHNMFAYCDNNPVNCKDVTGKGAAAAAGWAVSMWWLCGADALLPIGDIIYVGGIVVIGIFALNTTITAPSVPTYNYREKDKTSEKDKEATKTKPNNRTGTTYYHSTSTENAWSILATNTLSGSSWEGGYVYAWKSKPNKYALNNSGARIGVLISFKTNATFVNDPGIDDPKVQKFGPVVSSNKGPIVIWDVKIERVYR